MAHIIDVSLGIGPDMAVWPGDPAVEVVPRLQIASGDPANVSELRIGTHTGTHVDPPVHFIEGGGGVDAIPLELVYGEAWVADARGRSGSLGPEELDAMGVPPGTTRLLLRSDNSELWRRDGFEFPDSYVCLATEGARWVLERGIRLIGVDFLSVEQAGAKGHPVHKLLLGNGAVIVEGLDLWLVEPGRGYMFVCLPLRVLGGDGGPARAALIVQ